MAKIFKLFVELYELLLTTRKDDFMGRVSSTGSFKVDDVISIAVSRRTDLNAATLKASYEILNEIVLESICDGKDVEFGPSHYRLTVNGVFIGEHASWNPAEHKLSLTAVPTAKARQALKNVAVEVRGVASSGTCINTLTDATTGEVNTRITAGGGVNLEGLKMKITGEASGTGLFLTDIASGEVRAIPTTSILVNDPSRITFIVPASLPEGNYRLSIATQFSAYKTTKAPRIYVFEHVLICDHVV